MTDSSLMIDPLNANAQAWQGRSAQHLQHWLQLRLDAAVADCFGFHALQLGLPQVDGLRANRMPSRWVGWDPAAREFEEMWPTLKKHTLSLTSSASAEEVISSFFLPDYPSNGAHFDAHLRLEYEALPFPAESIDLVVLPFTLELAHDAQALLREVYRVLRPNGQVVIAGFNPTSLWDRHRCVDAQGQCLSERIGYWRLRDWLGLLGLEIETHELAMYRPFMTQSRWFDRLAWMETWGQRWWPVFGAVYFFTAIKRVPATKKMRRAVVRQKAMRLKPSVAHRAHRSR